MLSTLLDHRERLRNNTTAYTDDIGRCYESVVKHLKHAGYEKITFKKAEKQIKEFVDLIFDSQDNKPFFHISSESGLPFCWNSPAKNGWDIDYIKYEWGHLLSKNQNGNSAHCIMNLCLQSARCNQHIQSSMNVEELKAYGGKLESVINKNLGKRAALFSSDKWSNLVMAIEPWR